MGLPVCWYGSSIALRAASPISSEAVAQNQPCEEKGVSWGKHLCFEKESPMRTPNGLYADERIIYHPELLTCPHCGDLLVMYNSLAWDKRSEERRVGKEGRTGKVGEERK